MGIYDRDYMKRDLPERPNGSEKPNGTTNSIFKVLVYVICSLTLILVIAASFAGYYFISDPYNNSILIENRLGTEIEVEPIKRTENTFTFKRIENSQVYTIDLNKLSPLSENTVRLLPEGSSRLEKAKELLDGLILSQSPNYPIVPTPDNGAAEFFTNEKRIAPLKIETSSKTNFFVKLISADSRETVMTVFIRGGSSVSVDVPIGSYKFMYTSGNKWFGKEHLFGPGALFQEAYKPFDFVENDNQISGYTVSLDKVFDGNLRTKNIKGSEF